tara:strand:- start:476 stop:2155 length:1680 start_codon:yes stop_codon:yes gene_type:complete
MEYLFGKSEELKIDPIQSNEKTLLTNKLLNYNEKNDTNLKELEFFTNHNHTDKNTVFKSIDKTQTIFGNILLKEQLANYNYNEDKINKTKELVNYIKNNNISTDLSTINNITDDVLWFYKEVDESLQQIFDQLYFNLPINKVNDLLNNNKLILNITSIYNIYINPLLNIIGPIASILVPLILLRCYGIKLPVSFFLNIVKQYVSGIKSYKQIFTILIYVGIYLYSFYRQIKQSVDLKKMINVLHSKLISVKQFIQSSKTLIEQFSDYFPAPDISNCENKLNVIPPKIKMIEKLGDILYTVNYIRNNIELSKLFRFVGEIDCIFCINNLINKENYCFTTFKKSNKMYIYFKDLYHPSVIKPIKNTIKIKNNITITGPNAAGKSTFIKAVTINIILSQSLGISSSRKAIITPIEYIKTHLNMPDTLNKESLFEAEMNKCKSIIDNISDKKSFIVLDELFSSTNYKEGLSGSCAILNKLNKSKNTRILITTHYDKLPEYTKKIGFKNYKFCASTNDGGIQYTYKIKKGISKKGIAIDILKKNNYDKDIIEDAKKIFQSFKSD